MENKDLIAFRIKDLSLRAKQYGYITHTNFLSMSEQSVFFDDLKSLGGNEFDKTISGVKYVLFGGREESDRKIAYFLPEYENVDSFLTSEMEGETISLLKIYPKNLKFSDDLTHRDYLGALMNLGIERNQYGDILTDGKTGYVFILKQVVQTVKEELTKIKHTVVEIEELKPKDCPLKMNFIEKSFTVSSERIDSIIAHIYSLARDKAQRLIADENVFINGRTIKSNSYILKEGERVSIKGYGKFIYLGLSHMTKKNKCSIKVKLYS